MNRDQLIAMTMADGTLSIMAFCVVARGNVLPPGAVWLNDGSSTWFRDPTDAQIQSEIDRATHGGMACASWRRMDPFEVPINARAYRYAWEDRNGRIVVDLDKAKAVHVARLRKLRQPEFVRLDAEWMKAMGQGDHQAAASIEAKRQLLRDAPADPRLAVAQSLEDLMSVTLPDV